jgi:glutathione S-transferase
MRALDLVTSTAASAARLGLGDTIVALGPRPAAPLLLWEFEACPFCRKVREAISLLDLEVLVHPCPKRGERFRPDVVARGGRAQFPYLVDPNDGDRALYESDAIVAHLFARYGTKSPPLRLRMGPLTAASAGLASALRPRRGSRARPSRAAEKPLELWGYEPSPRTRLVRERLSELELPYLLRPTAHGSPTRGAFRARYGEVEIPFLTDPSAGVATFGDAAIIEHLERTYALPT